jgi:competence protein ComEC
VALSALHPVIGLVPLLVSGLALDLCRRLIFFFAEFSWAYFWVGCFPVIWLAVWYAGFGVLAARMPRRRKALVLLGLLAVAGVGAFLKLPGAEADDAGKLRVTVLDVKQGSCTLVRFPDGQTMLVDGGGFHRHAFDVGRYVLAPYLWREGIRKLDWVVLTHDQADHRNGLRFILRHFKVGCFWESGFSDGASGVGLCGLIAHRRGIETRTLPDIFGDHPYPADEQVSSYNIRVLHPGPEYLESYGENRDLNNLSLVLQIDYGNTRCLLPGDINRSVEEFLFHDSEPYSGESLLVVPHHGSSTSTGATLLDAVQPRLAVVPCGFDNPFGFPHEEVLSRLRERGIDCYRTDLHGAVDAVSDGERWEVKQTVELSEIRERH